MGRFATGAVFLLLACMAMVHLALTPWAQLFLYNGDSITLALLVRSVLSGEPFHWVLSSQLFIFPEGPIYFVSQLIVGNPKYALFLNAFLNLVVLFFGYRTVGRVFLEPGKANRFALGGLLLVVFLMLCETRLAVNQGSIATLILFNTYYCGVIFTALFLLALYGKVAIALERDTRTWVFGAVAIVLTALTYLSDPLIFLQFSAPFIAVVLVLWILGRLGGFLALFFTATQFVGVLSGGVLRGLFKKYIGASVDSYLHFDRLNLALNDLWMSVQTVRISRLSVIEYLVIFLVLASVAVLALYLLNYRRARFFAGSRKVTGFLLLVLLFTVVAPIVIAVGVLATGSFYTRYLLPVIFFTPLGFLPIFFSKRATAVGSGLFILLFAGALVLSGRTIHDGSWSYMRSDDVDCFNAFMQKQEFDSLGGYWSARALDLYSSSPARVLQITGLAKQHWLNNAGAYEGHTFSGLIVDKGPVTPDHVYSTDAEKLGAYSRKAVCPNFDILFYDSNSDGFRALNDIARK